MEYEAFTRETSEDFVERHRVLMAAQERAQVKLDMAVEKEDEAAALEARDHLSRLLYEAHDLALLELREHLLAEDVELSRFDDLSFSCGGRLLHVSVRKHTWSNA